MTTCWPPNTRAKLFAAVLLLAALGYYLRVFAILETVVDHPIRNDASEYYFTAYNFAKYGVFSLSQARAADPNAVLAPDSFRWPGLPLLIAPFMSAWPDQGAIIRDVQWVNVAAGTAAILLMAFAAVRALPAWFALAAVAMTAISPHLISFTVYLLTETPATLFIGLLLALSAVQPAAGQGRNINLPLAIGLTIGALAMFRPIFCAFAPLVALAAPRDRLRVLALVLAGAAVLILPWLIRDALYVAPGTTPSSLGETLIIGAYPGYMYHGDPSTFPFPGAHDPDFLKVSASTGTALAEIWRRICADPAGMLQWYVFGKPHYLWQFDNIDGDGDVFVYPVDTSPFQSDSLLIPTHALMRVLHWPIVLSALAGSVLAWLPWASAPLPERSRTILRTASLILAFMTIATLPLNDPARFAVPVYPALFLTAMATPVLAGRTLARRALRLAARASSLRR